MHEQFLLHKRRFFMNRRYFDHNCFTRAHTTDIMGLHPTLNTKRELNFTEEEDSNKLSENERISLSLMKEKHAFNQVFTS